MPTLTLTQAVAAELRDLKAKAELSNRQISERTGIPEVSVQRYIAGKRSPKVDELAAMTIALGGDPTVLFAAAAGAAAGVHGED